LGEIEESWTFGIFEKRFVISFVQRQRRRGRGRIKGRGQGLMGLPVEDEQWRRGKNRRWHRRDEVRDEWSVECARG